MIETVGLNEEQARFCYGMSLQTQADIVKNSFMKCWHIEVIEFLEMIGRCANMLYQDQIPLHKKINRLLDEWLPLCDQERKEPNYFKGSDESHDED